jgi:hypothetical protein
MGGTDALLSIEESIPLVVDMVEANRGSLSSSPSSSTAASMPGCRGPRRHWKRPSSSTTHTWAHSRHMPSFCAASIAKTNDRLQHSIEHPS